MESKVHGKHPASHKALLWAAGIGTALVLAPYALPFLGVGSSEITKDVIDICGSKGAYGTGLSGIINNGLKNIPGIGESLAAGGWTVALTSGILGIGGSVLGNYISKHYDKPGQIPWGKIIKYTAMATSLLVALPSLLSGVSMGITFLAMAFTNEAISSTVIGAMQNTLGFMGAGAMQSMGAGGLTGLLPHLVSCGAAALPAFGSLFSARPDAKPTTQTHTHQLGARVQAPATAMIH